MDSNDSLFRKIPFFCLGLAVPSLVLGRSVMAVMMIAGVIALVFSRPNRRSIVEGFRRSARDPLFFLALVMFVSWLPGLFESRAPLHSVQTCVRTIVFVAVFGLAVVAVVSYWLFHVRAPVVAPEGEWMFPTWLIDYERQTMWRHVWRIAWEAPWFGIGANTINLTPGADVVIPGTNDTHVIPSHPHNWMIEVFAETGLVGLFSLCAVAGSALWRVVREYRAGRDPAWLAAVAVMIGYWTSGLFNFSLWAAWWQVSLLVTMVACVAGGLDSRTASDGAEVDAAAGR